jgi:2-polyprenyl-3-methyl-5-hydroxy-6-metoxy-1,4-benzoquinol methylase
VLREKDATVQDLESHLKAVVDEHGPWTAMSIKLPGGVHTRDPAVDHRLKRILQVCNDIVGKPLSQCRVLDLACLEGHYALEFAAHGSEVVGIEGRAASVAKCNFARDALGFERAVFHQDDVRNLSVAKYGVFDIVVCSGLLYHLPARDAWALIRAMHDVCQGIVVVDTFIALSDRVSVELDGASYHGHVYGEHGADDSAEAKASKLWASLDNESSFWFTEPSLLNLFARAGYTSSFEVLVPTMPGNLRDRKTYVAMKGRPARVLTSDETDRQPGVAVPEGVNPRMDESQVSHGAVFNVAKRVLPQGVKDAIKPILRAVRLLPADQTPEFQRESARRKSAKQ